MDKKLKVVLLSCFLVIFVAGWCWGLYSLFKPKNEVRIQSLDWYKSAILNPTKTHMNIKSYLNTEMEQFKVDGDISYWNDNYAETYRVIYKDTVIDYTTFDKGTSGSWGKTERPRESDRINVFVDSYHWKNYFNQFFETQDYNNFEKAKLHHIYSNNDRRVEIAKTGMKLYIKERLELEISLSDYEIDTSIIVKN